MFEIFKKKFDFNAYVQASMEGLRLVTDTHRSTWHLGQETNWSVDQGQGKIVFTFSDGTIAEAPVQIVGTFNSRDDSFMWGWDHPSVMPELQANARKVREFGRENKINELQAQTIECSEQRAWELTAVAMRLSEANGAYRGEAGPGTYVFMNFGTISLSKNT